MLYFKTKEITIDQVILPKRDINSLTMSKMDRAWAVNEQQLGTRTSKYSEGTQHVIHILDAKYEEADLQSVVGTNCTHRSLQDQNKYWSCSWNLRNYLMEHWGLEN